MLFDTPGGVTSGAVFESCEMEAGNRKDPLIYFLGVFTSENSRWLYEKVKNAELV